MNTTARKWTSAAFFLLCGIYPELLLHIADRAVPLSFLIALRLVLSGAAVGCLLWLISMLILGKKPVRITLGIFLFLSGALIITYHCCHVFFGLYFQVSFMTSMASQVAGSFLDATVRTLLRNLWFFPLALLPFLLFLAFSHAILPEKPGKIQKIIAAVLFPVLLILSLLACHAGTDSEFYTSEFTANNAVPRFGLAQSLRLEAQYAVFGIPVAQTHYVPPVTETTAPPETTALAQPAQTVPAESETVPEETEPEPIVYGKNVTDIDWSALSEDYPMMDSYFSGLEPTSQNAYTGMFAGKNLIFLTAEAFSYALIDPERTPTLYKLSTEGFVFSNYYQPGWTQSTTGGEFANMTGIIPTWVNGSPAFQISSGDAMPLAMGWKFREIGYETLAFHNNNYVYYNRHETHPNLGYTYRGYGNGLELKNPQWWPCSDLEMMENTVPGIVQNYLETGTPFHAYYMTVSGHANYGFSYNSMAEKNRDTVADLPYSDTVLAYLSANMELEYAMTYLLEQLEQAGILEDTVIVLSPDHYPYAMTQDCPKDYYAELTGIDDSERYTSRYRNTLILWNGGMEEPVPIDTPCSSIDIVPTLYNLFGIEFDSRLLSGRDILDDSVAPGEVSTAMNIVVFPSYGGAKSWITNAGILEGADNTFTPFDGVTVSEDYVRTVSDIVTDRWTFARLIIESNYYRHIYPDWQRTQ